MQRLQFTAEAANFSAADHTSCSLIVSLPPWKISSRSVHYLVVAGHSNYFFYLPLTLQVTVKKTIYMYTYITRTYCDHFQRSEGDSTSDQESRGKSHMRPAARQLTRSGLRYRNCIFSWWHGMSHLSQILFRTQRKCMR